MILSIIAAVDKNKVIGNDNRLPWRLPADMKHFVAVTRGKPVIMGRRTYESIGRALKDRKNIIITRDRSYRADGCVAVHSVEEAIEAAGGAGEAVVIGGASVYEQFLPFTNRMYLTLVSHAFEGDVFFPVFDPSEWEETERTEHKKDGENPYDYAFITLERR